MRTHFARPFGAQVCPAQAAATCATRSPLSPPPKHGIRAARFFFRYASFPRLPRKTRGLTSQWMYMNYETPSIGAATHAAETAQTHAHASFLIQRTYFLRF